MITVALPAFVLYLSLGAATRYNAIPVAPPPARPEDRPLIAEPPPDMSHLRAKGGRMRFGRLDGNGDFVPALIGTFVDGPGASGSLPDFAYNLTHIAAEVLEHRTGALIRGTLWNDQFVPHVGSPVVAAKSLEAAVDGRFVYNQRGPGVHYGKSPRVTRPASEPPVPPPLAPGQDQDPSPANYVPRRLVPEPLARPPASWQVVPFERAYRYDFVQGPPYVVRVAADRMEYGQLDLWGEFIPDYRLPVMPKAAAPPPNKLIGAPGYEWRFTYNLPVGGKTEPVYEFRSGRLIKGTLHEDGHFAPAIGSTVLEFKDYKPGPGPRIYNLPGVLQPVKR